MYKIIIVIVSKLCFCYVFSYISIMHLMFSFVIKGMIKHSV